MKQLLISLCIAFAAKAGAQPFLTNLVLNPRQVITVPVAMDRLSAIVFPSAISHLEGAYLSPDVDPPARFQVSFKPGNAYFSVRALSPNASAAVNVVWHRKTFVFELGASPRPLLALTLVEPISRDATSPNNGPTAHRLLGILDTAKAYTVLRTQHPDEIGDIAFVPKQDRYDFGTYELHLQEIFHFKTEDTLVFRVLFRNKSSQPIRYQPQSFRVRVGARVFYAAIADGDGTVPPYANMPVYFAITSAPDGSRPGLSPQNDFTIMYMLTGPATTPTQPLAHSNSGGVPIYHQP
jgi:hypothetical protein